MSDLLLNALRCQNTQRPPVWLMRQAGRYMPEYQALRKKYPLEDLFRTPELSYEITKLPLSILDVDAAILFSDILVVAEMFGLTFRFPITGGAFIEPSITSAKEAAKLPLLPAASVLGYVQKTIQLLKKDISKSLIGFCGGPFTIANYLLTQEVIKKEIHSDPKSLHLTLDKITKASIDYLTMQINAGVDAIQIFDSWANLLSLEQFEEYSLKYLKQIVEALSKTDVPIILFCRGSCFFASQLARIKPNAISFDWQKEMRDLREIVPSSIAIQGNIDPELLLAPTNVIESAVKRLMKSMQGERGFIVNLGHGVLPNTPVDHVRCFCDTVKNFH